jgi:glutathione synthase/RimK-type ligase-like ATP-grasp enzyme
MKATIIGSDLLQTGDSVKFLEINTNTTIYNEGADLLDYTSLFTMLVSNNITEFYLI